MVRTAPCSILAGLRVRVRVRVSARVRVAVRVRVSVRVRARVTVTVRVTGWHHYGCRPAARGAAPRAPD